MKKTLYSLILSEEVVREIDILAHRIGTNRSSLVNEILAEYVNYTTPEKRINDILSAIERIMTPSRDFVPSFMQNSPSLSLKSSLEYKYRPTVRYELELYKSGDSIGTLSINFRTTSQELLLAMGEFFRLWISIEERHLAPLLGMGLNYELADGRFTRILNKPAHDCGNEALAAAISDYIKLFDMLMKGYLALRFDEREVEAAYFSRLRSSGVHF